MDLRLQRKERTVARDARGQRSAGARRPAPPKKKPDPGIFHGLRCACLECNRQGGYQKLNKPMHQVALKMPESGRLDFALERRDARLRRAVRTEQRDNRAEREQKANLGSLYGQVKYIAHPPPEEWLPAADGITRAKHGLYHPPDCVCVRCLGGWDPKAHEWLRKDKIDSRINPRKARFLRRTDAPDASEHAVRADFRGPVTATKANDFRAWLPPITIGRAGRRARAKHADPAFHGPTCHCRNCTQEKVGVRYSDANHRVQRRLMQASSSKALASLFPKGPDGGVRLTRETSAILKDAGAGSMWTGRKEGVTRAGSMARRR